MTDLPAKITSQTIIRPDKNYKVSFIVTIILLVFSIVEAAYLGFVTYESEKRISTQEREIEKANKQIEDASTVLYDSNIAYEELEAASKNYIKTRGDKCEEGEDVLVCLTRMTNVIKQASCTEERNEVCPSDCTVENDYDCCISDGEHEWYLGECIASRTSNCSIIEPNLICDEACSITDDADCCIEREQNVGDFEWDEIKGCVPAE